MDNIFVSIISRFLAFVFLIFIVCENTFAHCDTRDGPVIQAAKVAFTKGDVTPVLKWVKPEYEQEIRKAFKNALIVRSKGSEALELADQYFFETLVRLHRAGEGEAFTGIKPEGAVEPAVAAADDALASGKIDQLAGKIANAVQAAIESRFHEAYQKQKHMNDNVDAGRSYVKSYVDYVHFVERVHLLVEKGAGHSHDH